MWEWMGTSEQTGRQIITSRGQIQLWKKDSLQSVNEQGSSEGGFQRGRRSIRLVECLGQTIPNRLTQCMKKVFHQFLLLLFTWEVTQVRTKIWLRLITVWSQCRAEGHRQMLKGCAMPKMERKQTVEILHWMQYVTGSHCSFWRTVRMWTDFIA